MTDFGFVFTVGQGSQTGGTECTAGGAAFVGHDVELQNIGQQLRPPTAARTATEQRRLLDFGAAFLQHAHAVGDAEAHALNHRIAHHRAVGAVAQAVKHAGGVCVIVRGAFAGKIGQEDRRGGFVFCTQGGDFFQQFRFAYAHQLAIPAQTGGGAEHHAHLVPAVRQRVAEAVHGVFRGRAVAVVYHKHHT